MLGKLPLKIIHLFLMSSLEKTYTQYFDPFLMESLKRHAHIVLLLIKMLALTFLSCGFETIKNVMITSKSICHSLLTHNNKIEKVHHSRNKISPYSRKHFLEIATEFVFIYVWIHPKKYPLMVSSQANVRL